MSAQIMITKDWLKPHEPCADGYGWFLKSFPQGGTFAEVYAGLRAERRYSDSDWLVEKAFIGLPTVDKVGMVVAMAGADKTKIAAQVVADGAKPDATATTGEGANAATTGEGANAATTGEGANAATTGEGANAATTGYRANAATTGEGANAATTGYRANAATTGYRANAATTGEGANAATTGEGANAATTGYRANAATTGEGANAATTGEGANAATTGYRANAATTGEKAISASLGFDGTASAGPDGALILAYFDQVAKRPRVVVAYVGEDGILPGVTYRLDAAHKFEVVV